MDENKPDLERPENRFESSDVDTRAVGKFGIALALLCIISLALVFGLFRYFFVSDEARNTVRPSHNAGVRVPPQPQLEKTPALDLQRMFQEEDEALNSYGWGAGGKGLGRIRIDAAIARL